jgi:hypothetical protein
MTTTTAALSLASLASLARLATPAAASTLHSAVIGHLIVCCVYKQCEEKKINF